MTPPNNYEMSTVLQEVKRLKGFESVQHEKSEGPHWDACNFLRLPAWQTPKSRSLWASYRPAAQQSKHRMVSWSQTVVFKD